MSKKLDNQINENQTIEYQKLCNRPITEEELNFILNNKNKLTLKEIAEELKIPIVYIRKFFSYNNLLFLTNQPNRLRFKLLDIAIKDGETNLYKLSQKSYITVERIEQYLIKINPILYFTLVNATYGTKREPSYYILKSEYNKLKNKYDKLQLKYNVDVSIDSLKLQEQCYKLKEKHDLEVKNIKSEIKKLSSSIHSLNYSRNYLIEENTKLLKNFDININKFSTLFNLIIDFSNNSKISKDDIMSMLKKSDLNIIAEALEKINYNKE